MKFVPRHVEAEVGSELEMPLAVYGRVQGTKAAHRKIKKLFENLNQKGSILRVALKLFYFMSNSILYLFSHLVSVSVVF